MTVGQLIADMRDAAGGWEALGKALGLPLHRPRDWGRRGAIPVDQIANVASTARSLGLSVTLEDVVTAHSTSAQQGAA